MRDESNAIVTDRTTRSPTKNNGLSSSQEEYTATRKSIDEMPIVLSSESAAQRSQGKTSARKTVGPDEQGAMSRESTDRSKNVEIEPERERKSILRDEVSGAKTEQQIQRDRVDQSENGRTTGMTAIIETVLASRNAVLPPAYGSAALAVAEQMERATGEEQLQRLSRIMETEVSQPDSEIKGEETQGIADAVEEVQKGESQPTDSDDSIPAPKDEVGEEARIPIRPPVLASEALREQIAPAEPGRDTIRILSVLIGTFGTTITLLLLGTSGIGLPLAGAFLALTALGLPSMPYAPRAAAIFAISASTLGVVTWIHVVTMGAAAEVVEIIGVVILGAALRFRAWHRASITARVLVAVGIAACVSWLGMSGWLKDFTTLDPAWQSWLPTLIRAPIALLLMLSLLAFMDARTTGGCGIWTIAVLLWHGLYMTVQLIILVWPKEVRVPSWQRLSDDLSAITSASIAGPLLAVLVVFSVAQLLAVAFNSELRSK
ncbi:MAG: hypothetical protein JXA30_20685 [Deltaproteobacteria bacterium]|nr:hypothetical protein [Deltaproteobacteria bacterium]